MVHQKELLTSSLRKRADFLLSRLQTEQIRRNVWEVERTKLQLNVKDKRDITVILLQVMELFKSLGGDSEQQVLEKIQTFVSYGIGVVFGGNYKFVPVMRTDGKELRVDFNIITNDLKTGVIGAKGGGLAEVISILMQIFFVLVDKKLSRFIVLDAALIHLSERYWKNMSQLLSEITEKMDIQILLLAHVGDYGEYADRLYEFTQKKGRTKVRRVK